MRYVYPLAETLQGMPKIGTKHCVVLVQHYTQAPPTRYWREGAKVRGNSNLIPGVAIATFINGVYPNQNSGNHAAFYLSQDREGIWMMDQWTDDIRKPFIRKRKIKFHEFHPPGKVISPSNIGDAYSVIE